MNVVLPEERKQLAIDIIDHTRIKTSHSQINGIRERFHWMMWNKVYRVAFRRYINRTLDELQFD